MERELLNLSGELSKVRTSHEAYPLFCRVLLSHTLLESMEIISKT